MIEYINISYEEYRKLSEKESKEKPFCIEHFNGVKIWIVNGLYHRENGPAVIWHDGDMGWYLNNNYYQFEEWLDLTPISNDEKIFLKLKYFGKSTVWLANSI